MCHAMILEKHVDRNAVSLNLLGSVYSSTCVLSLQDCETAHYGNVCYDTLCTALLGWAGLRGPSASSRLLSSSPPQWRRANWFQNFAGPRAQQGSLQEAHIWPGPCAPPYLLIRLPSSRPSRLCLTVCICISPSLSPVAYEFWWRGLISSVIASHPGEVSFLSCMTFVCDFSIYTKPPHIPQNVSRYSPGGILSPLYM